MIRIGSAALLVVLAIAPPALATPRPPTEAEVLFGQGVEAFEAGRYAAAAALLSQAYALEPEARLAFNTGLAYERAGQLREARSWYSIAAGADESELRDAAKEALTRLPADEMGPKEPSDAAKARREATLLVRTEAPIAGASLRIDGGHALALPATVVVPAGVHALSVEAPGYGLLEETVTAGAGAELPVVLSPVPIAVERGVPMWWVTGGVASAAMVTGAGFYFAAAADFDEAERLGEEGVDRVGFDRAQSDGRSAATLSNASYGVALLAGAATGLLWWWEREAGEPEALTLRPTLGPNQAGFAACWRP